MGPSGTPREDKAAAKFGGVCATKPMEVNMTIRLSLSYGKISWKMGNPPMGALVTLCKHASNGVGACIHTASHIMN